MFLKKLFLPIVILFAAAAAPNFIYSQDEAPQPSIKITLPEFPVIIGNPDEGYDKEGYDKYGYDRYGYDRYGYDQKGYDRNGYDRNGYDANGYNKSGYDMYGYDRNGYDIYGKQREPYYDQKDPGEHQDNGKHKGWDKKKKNKKNKKHKNHDNIDDPSVRDDD